MAADSIAKLAVIITGDASPLNAELAKASAAVNRWPASMRNLQNPLGPTSTNPLGLAAGYVSAAEGARKLAHNTDGVTSSAFKMAQALSAGRGNLAAIWNIGAGGGPATAIAAAAAAAGNFGYNIAVAADKIQTDLTTAVDDFIKKRDELFYSSYDARIKSLQALGLEMELSRKNFEGLIEPGNIDLLRRPKFVNEDGSISTVRSLGVNIEGVETLLPTISKLGELMSDMEAIEEFSRTGEHLGKFLSAEDATRYAELLHTQQELFYGAERLSQLSFDLDPNGTWTSAQANLTEEMGKSGLSLANVFRDLTDGASMAMKAAREYREELALINSGFMLLSPPEDAAKIDKRREELAVQMAILKSVEDRKKLAEEQEKKDAQAREKARRHIQDMAKDANDFASSLNTPLEALAAKFEKLRELFKSGAIGPERMETFAGRMLEEFREQQDRLRPKDRDVRGTPAAERFTQAGQSAIESGRRELQKIERDAKKTVDEAKKAAIQRDRILQAIKDNKPIELLQGDL